MSYDFKAIEKKWQDKWEKEKVFEVEKSDKPKFYNVEMFPYPSGSGLHIGHTFNYTIGDILSRYKRMKGFNVLYPAGYDAFGLPAENAAIKAGENPKDYTDKAVKNFANQQRKLGLSYDWTRSLSTCDPEYYKWNQFFFLKLLEKGLAYRKKAPVNYCPKCQTVLANEQVHSGMCWRHEDTEVEIRHLNQWFVKTTDYADELYEKIDSLKGWPERIRTMQKNWIGKSEGTEVEFEIENPYKKEKISNVVIVHGSNSSEESAKKGGVENTRHWHPWLRKNLEERGMRVSGELYPRDWNPDYNEWKKVFEKSEINENTVLVGHSSGCAFILRWLSETKRKVGRVVLVAPYLMDFPKAPGLSDLVSFNLSKNLENIVIFYSEDDDEYILESVDYVKNSLDVKLVNFRDKGHFTGKSMGTNEFPELLNEILGRQKWPVFTTRVDTIFGVTFMVVSAQHPKLMDLVTKEQKKEVEKFVKRLKGVSEKQMEELEKKGVFTGSYAINPMNGERIPIWAGNFVVADYGSGMVMAVPSHDQRDFDFAKKYGIDVKTVIEPITGVPQENPEHRKSVGVLVEDPKSGKLLSINWGNKGGNIFIGGGLKEGEDPVECARREVAEETGYHDLEFVGKTVTIHHNYFAHSKNKPREIDAIGFYFKLKSEKKEEERLEEDEKGNFSVEWITKDEVEKKVKDELHKYLFDTFIKGKAYEGNGILTNSGDFDGLKSWEAKKHISGFLESKGLGKKTINFKLRDWLVSRQRYWGTPIPVVYCDHCANGGPVPVSEKDLPIELPDKVEFGKGNPLETNKDWISTGCPNCGKKGERETDTMDTFFDSSWYFLRYLDNKNSEKAFDAEKANYWMPVDQYIGGAEHATMHLIYARFFVKALRDMGYVDLDEPFENLFNQGLIHASDGEKMSKSKGNVVDPLAAIEKSSADAVRMFLVSVASPDSPFSWDESGLESIYKFIIKVVNYFEKVKIGEEDAKTLNKLNKVIGYVGKYIEGFNYNLAVIKLRELFNSLPEETSKDVLEKFLKILHPFCPHVTEEMWEKIGNNDSGNDFISLASWPEVDESKISEEIERQEEAVEKLIDDINNVFQLIKEKEGKGAEKCIVYILPNEKEVYESESKEIMKRTGLDLEIYAVNDPEVKSGDKDPEGKAKKVKPGKPGIYLE